VEAILLSECSYWKFLWRLLRASKEADAMILRGTSGFSERYAEAVAAMLIKLRRSPPLILVSDATWSQTSKSMERRVPRFARPLLPKLARLGARAADGPHVVYGVLSINEQQTFHELWGIDPSRVIFTPFFATVPESLVEEVSDGGYVFAGGNTSRNYQLLVDVAEGLDAPVVIASSWKPSGPLPSNVEVTYVPQEQYHLMMAAARVIVVPLGASQRTAGQQTYLSAMLLGKPVIITEAPGVHDYVESGESALIVDNATAALGEAIRWTLDPLNSEAVDRMAAHGRRLVQERYLAPTYYKKLWDVAIERGVRLAQRRANQT
jgi:hypothetical protein